MALFQGFVEILSPLCETCLEKYRLLSPFTLMRKKYLTSKIDVKDVTPYRFYFLKISSITVISNIINGFVDLYFKVNLKIRIIYYNLVYICVTPAQLIAQTNIA